jgi:hypothetical protein
MSAVPIYQYSGTQNGVTFYAYDTNPHSFLWDSSCGWELNPQTPVFIGCDPNTPGAIPIYCIVTGGDGHPAWGRKQDAQGYPTTGPHFYGYGQASQGVVPICGWGSNGKPAACLADASAGPSDLSKLASYFYARPANVRSNGKYLIHPDKIAEL